MRFSAMIVAIASLPGLPVSAGAQTAVEEKNLLSGKEVFDSESGYIFNSGPTRLVAMFLRLPEPTDISDYEKRWGEALSKAKADYGRNLVSWEKAAQRAAAANRESPPRPVEPTAEDFEIEPIEMTYRVTMGPQFVFAKNKDPENYSFLSKVKPGRYAYYGPVIGIGGSVPCYCMGTVRFDVKPGVITDLGNFLVAAPQFDPAFPRAGVALSEATQGLYGMPYGLPPPRIPVSYGLPPSLAHFPNVRAEFRAHGKISNFWGLNVNRLYPVPGVLAYDRDIPVDATTGTPADRGY
jgi:hypothetical protein